MIRSGGDVKLRKLVLSGRTRRDLLERTIVIFDHFTVSILNFQVRKCDRDMTRLVQTSTSDESEVCRKVDG